MKKSTQKVIETLGWILTMLILPILGMILWIFRMRNLKKKNPEMTRGYMWWAFGTAGTVWFLILFPIVFFIALVIANPEDFTSSLDKTEETSQYGSAEGLYCSKSGRCKKSAQAIRASLRHRLYTLGNIGYSELYEV